MAFSQLYPIAPESLPTIHTSVMLRRLIDNVPPDHFTLDWLMSNMPNRSYGVIILFLAFLSFVPIVGVFSRLIIMLFAVQIMCGYRCPVLPHRFRMRKFPSHHLTRLPAFTLSVLTRLERSIRPRWSAMLGVRRLSGLLLFLLCLVSLLLPLPFANVPAAAIIALMALAYLEHDGLLLVVVQTAGFAMLGLIGIAFFEASYL